ncbi:MAG TPA: hypothetical protein VMG60_02690 [Burkholderiaceae bacterium]|nr:hypothetical protein [Burkholderiaceae bacterium]
MHSTNLRRRELVRALCAGLSTLAAAPLRAAEFSDSEYLTATARVLAGFEPGIADERFERLVERKAWRDQLGACRAGATKLKQRLAAIDAWRRENLGDDANSGTLVYPFSGPDFINAYAMFPGCDNYVFFSLEEPGVPPALEKMDPEHLARALSDLRLALNDLVHLNFFITPNMEQQVRASSLRGVTPILMAMMALLDLRIERFSKIDLWPERIEAIAQLPAAKRPRLPMQAIQIDFLNPANGRSQALWYFSLDVSDAQLKQYPEFVEWLRDFRDPVVLLKSASYLLHGDNFRQVRSFILDRASQIVQDDTGIPYRMLADDPWKVALYGRYEQPVDLFKKRYQTDLASAFSRSSPGKNVPFPFGYNWRTHGNSFVIVARRA